MRLVGVALAATLLAVTACGSPSTASRRPGESETPSTSPTIQPSPAPAAPESGVLVLTGSGPLGLTTSTRYFIYVIGLNGRILRSTSAGVPSVGWQFPRVSVAGQSVYFIDGNQTLKVLRNDGSVSAVGTLPGSVSARVVFAVSPDENEIAYSVLKYAGSTATTSLGVGNLDGSGMHEIYGGSLVEFPIGWRSGALVLAVSPYAAVQNLGEVNPYFAGAYHVADARTAERTFSTSPTCDEPESLLEGPVNAEGSMCWKVSGNTEVLLALGWSGSKREVFRTPLTGSVVAGPPAVLSPDGQTAAAGTYTNHTIDLFAGGVAKPTAAVGTPAGWLDEDHLVFINGPCCRPSTSAAVLDVTTNSMSPIGVMTGTADPYAPFFSTIPEDLG